MTQVTNTLNLNELLNNEEFFTVDNKTNLVATVGKETIDINLLTLVSSVSIFGNVIHDADFRIQNNVPTISYAKMKTRAEQKPVDLNIKIGENLVKDLTSNIYVIKYNDIDIYFIWLNKYRFVAFEVHDHGDELKVRVHTNIAKALPPAITRLSVMTSAFENISKIQEVLKNHSILNANVSKYFVADWIINGVGSIEFYKQARSSRINVILDDLSPITEKTWMRVECLRKDKELVIVHKNGTKFHCQLIIGSFGIDLRTMYIDLKDLTWVDDIDLLKDQEPVVSEEEKEEGSETFESESESKLQLTDLSSLREHLKGMERLIDKLHNDPLNIDDLKALDKLDHLCSNLSNEVMDIQRRIEYMTAFEEDRRVRVSNSTGFDWSREARDSRDWRGRSRYNERPRRSSGRHR